MSVLDTACARLSLGQNATPPAIEDAQRDIDDCATQIRILEREAALGADHAERLEAIAKRKASLEESLAGMQARWEKERDLVNRIREVRGKLEVETPGAPPAVVAASGAAAPGSSAPVASASAAAPAVPATPVEDPAVLRGQLAELNAELAKKTRKGAIEQEPEPPIITKLDLTT